MKNKTISPRNYSSLLDRIADILVEARIKVVREINKAQVLAYWEIGREIIEFEQKGQLRAEYGEELLKELSAESGKFEPMLAWSHYCELLKVEGPLEGTAISQYANIT
jgi:hypothetical protein